MLKAEISSLLPVKHGFFTAEGGVSLGVYESLNGGIQTGDDPCHIAENRARMADFLGVEKEKFLPLTQIHSADILVLKEEDKIWSSSHAPHVDGIVTKRTDIALTIATADCVPLLFSSSCGEIVGAAHAGWKGAVGGIIQNTVKAMESLGAQEIYAVIGPSISAKSYEISAQRREDILAQLSGDCIDAEKYFSPSPREGVGKEHYLFDLPFLCVDFLKKAGVQKMAHLSFDTVCDPRFFSYRRQILTKLHDTGRQISAISARKREKPLE